jgi:nucleoside-diphosphate-sugar epimerase
MKVFLTGVTGFVGQHMLQRLLSEGHSVRGLMRPGPGGNRLMGFSSSTYPNWRENFRHAPGDVVSGAGLDAGMEDCEAVIHLVGIIVEKGKNTFDAVHHLGTRNVVEAAKRSGIRRFVQMSAVGVRADGVAVYQTSKWKGEEEVRDSGLPFCILRPSLIFGPGDGFVTQMMDTMRKAPLFRPVPGDGQAKYRPVFIDDVTTCFARALTAGEATHETIALGGADELSLNQVLEEIARCAGVRKPAVHIPMPLMFLGAAVAQTVLPNPPVTVDQLRMLREGSTCDIGPMKRVFAIEPRGFKGCGRDAEAHP